MRSLEQQIKLLQTRVSEEASRADEKVKMSVLESDTRVRDLRERHSRLRREHAALQAAVSRAGGGARGADALETDLMTERDDRFRRQLESLEANTRAEGKRAYEELRRAKENQIKQLTEQSEKFLADANRELAEVKAKAAADANAAASSARALREETNELRRWSVAMNAVLTKIERGSYPIVQRGTWRSLRVPPAEIPPKTANISGGFDFGTSTSQERTLAIHRAGLRAASFESRMEDIAASTSGASGFCSGAAGLSGGDDFGLETAADPNAFADEGVRGDDARQRASETFEMEAFRRRGALIDDERRAVQEATLKELSSHPTVEYIRGLEEENARARSELSRARRSNADARIALESARRQNRSLSSARRTESVPPGRDGRAPAPRETSAGLQLSPEAFRASVLRSGHASNGETASGLVAHAPSRNEALTSPEVVERVRVTTMSRDAARRAKLRRDAARGKNANENASGAAVGYLLARTASGGSGGIDDADARGTTTTATAGYLRHVGGARSKSNPRVVSSRSNQASPSKSRPRSGMKSGGSGSTSPRPPFGTAGGRRSTDAVPLPGRPLSGAAEVGYGFVLGDGPDARGGAVGWPAGSDRTKMFSERSVTRGGTSGRRFPGSAPSMPTIEASDAAMVAAQ